MSRILVIGLGNPILTDDGVGVRVARAVSETLPPRLQNEVEVTEAAVGGLRLMEMMAGYERVILIDAILAADPPGTLRRLTLPDLEAVSPTQHSASAHDASLITALEAGRRMGLRLPEDIVIYAIAAENVTDFGEQPTPAVARAIPKAVDAVLGELQAARE